MGSKLAEIKEIQGLPLVRYCSICRRTNLRVKQSKLAQSKEIQGLQLVEVLQLLKRLVLQIQKSTFSLFREVTSQTKPAA